MHIHCRYSAAFLCAAVLFTAGAAAANAQPSANKAAADSSGKLGAYFAYAKKADEKGRYRKAEKAYLKMLKANPGLHRVKLDLALLYTKTGRYQSSERLLDEVSRANPPAAVRKNIETVRKANKKGLKTHKLGGNITAGLRYDTNANSASSTDAITFLEQTVPLEDRSRAQDDIQYFGALGVNYRLRLPASTENADIFVNVSANAYGTKQQDIDELDLQLYGASAGPSVTFHESGVTLEANAAFNHIRLDNYDYLNSSKFGGGISKQLSDMYTLELNGAYEDRRFNNSPNSSVYEDRTGDAAEGFAGVKITLTPKDLLKIKTGYRRENTGQVYYDNDAYSGAASYTRILPKRFFTMVSADYRHREYDGADPLISSRVREDREAGAGVTLGKQFKNGFTLTAGYSYRKNDSNIRNYDYDNSRFTASAGKSF